ncbi:MAG TPA: patatin-like phospholipase family protein [candidate division Zixibacteria bacterium]|nr:patatin-like phospholipase family protein [candidate division Zixibacteria bacterium]
MISRLCCTLALVVVFCSLLTAQTAVPAYTPSRHRLGLALSGGGALGLAHVGVLQYFEEHHIPVDYIAGTSMGGLVAGFYSTGMDYAHMQAALDAMDFDTLLTPNLRFVDQPVVEKQKWNRPAGDWVLRFGKHFSLPAGLNPGEALSLLLSKETLAYADIQSFDDLPTPFRCVATDLVSEDKVVLSHGSLAKAMRATMSIPAIFTPVQWDKMVLVDGGVVENIPVSEVRAMGAKIVIAISLRVPTPSPEQFKSLAGVLRQTASIAILANERRSLKEANLVIDADTTRYTATDYNQSKAIVKAGYAAAKEMGDRLKPFELPEAEWQAYVQQRAARTRHAPREGRIVLVTSDNPDFRDNAQKELERKVGSLPISEKRLNDVLTGMVAATGVPGASYDWHDDPDQPQGYHVDFLTRSGDQLLARPSLHFDYSKGEPVRGGLTLATSTIFKNSYKSRLLTTTNIGYDPGLRAEYYQPLDGSAYFIAPGIMLGREHFTDYNGPERFDHTRERFGGSFYVGIGTWRFIQGRLGAQVGYDHYSSTVHSDGVAANSGAFVNPEAVFVYDTQDSGGLPKKGSRVEAKIGYSERDVPYPYFTEEYQRMRPVSRNVIFFLGNQAATSFGRKLGYFDKFTYGGLHTLSGYRYEEFHANSLYGVSGGTILHGPTFSSFAFKPALLLWYQAARLDLGSQGWQTHQSGSAMIFVPGPLGSAGIGVSFDEQGKARLRLTFGGF